MPGSVRAQNDSLMSRRLRSAEKKVPIGPEAHMIGTRFDMGDGSIGTMKVRGTLECDRVVTRFAERLASHRNRSLT